MRRKIRPCFFLLAFFISAWLQVNAQQQSFPGNVFDPNVVLSFDSSGKLVQFPRTVIRKGKKICFQTIVPEAFVFSQLKTFNDGLKKSLARLKEERTYESLFCYFKDAGQFDFSKYVRDLDTLTKLLDAEDFQNLSSIADIQNKYDSFKAVPASLFLQNLLLHQFEIKARVGSDVVKTIALDKIERKNRCFYFTADCNKAGDLACANCGLVNSSELSFDLMRTNPLSKTVQQWFDTTNQVLSQFDLTSIKGGLTGMSSMKITDGGFLTAHGKTKELKNWYPLWFWYTGGKLILDPFHLANKTAVKDIQDKIKVNEADITRLKGQKAFLDSVLNNISYRYKKFDLFKDVQKNEFDLANDIGSKEAENKKLAKQLAANTVDRTLLQSRSLLNNVSVAISRGNEVHPQIQFNAAQKYGLVARTKRQIHRVTELPDNEQAYVLVHNVDSSITLSVNQQRLAFDDAPEFTQIVFEQISKIDLTGTSTAEKQAAQDVIKSFFPVNKNLGISLKSDSEIKCPDDPKKNPVYADIKRLADEFAKNEATFFYEESIFKENDPAVSRFRTHSEIVKFNGESPFKDSITVKQTVGGKETFPLISKVNVGKLRFFQIAFGLAVTNKPVTVTTVDTTLGGFRVSSSENRARAIVGFKIYPFQYYTRDRWLIPRYPLHRLSVFGGFEMLHPLDNFYVGGSYDIVPGLGFSVGKNFYLKTNYKIENNRVTDTFRSYQKNDGVYYSVTVDPVIFVKFIKLFFKL